MIATASRAGGGITHGWKAMKSINRDRVIVSIAPAAVTSSTAAVHQRASFRSSISKARCRHAFGSKLGLFFALNSEGARHVVLVVIRPAQPLRIGPELPGGPSPSYVPRNSAPPDHSDAAQRGPVDHTSRADARCPLLRQVRCPRYEERRRGRSQSPGIRWHSPSCRCPAYLLWLAA
jgi:hypothetical protein